MSAVVAETFFAGQQVGIAKTASEAWLMLGATEAEAQRFAAAAVISGARTVGVGARRLTPAGSDKLEWLPADVVDADFATVGPTDDGRWLAAWCDARDRVATEAEADALCARRIEETGRRWLTVRRTLPTQH